MAGHTGLCSTMMVLHGPVCPAIPIIPIIDYIPIIYYILSIPSIPYNIIVTNLLRSLV